MRNGRIFLIPHVKYVRRNSIRYTSKAAHAQCGCGFTDKLPLSHFFRAVRYSRLGGGTLKMLRNLVSRKLMDQMDLASAILDLEYL